MNRNEAMAAVKRNPADPQAWLDLGAMLAIEGATREAKECYERALRLDPTLDEAQAALQAFAPTPAPAPPPPVRPPEPAPDDSPPAPSAPPNEESHPDWLLAMRERATDMPTEEEPELLDQELALAGEEEPDDIGSSEEHTDWMHHMRERIGDDPPPSVSGRRVNKRRLLIVLALLLFGVAICAGAARFFNNSLGGGSSEGDAAETVVPPLPTESPTLIATWTPRPTFTPRPTLPARATRTPPPALTATLEPTAAAQQGYRDFLAEVQAQYTPALQRLRELVSAARDNPALLEDSAWRLEMSSNIALVQFVDRKVFEEVPPESVQGFHQELSSAAQSYENAMILFESAIDGRNPAQLAEANELMSAATLAISRLTPP